MTANDQMTQIMTEGQKLLRQAVLLAPKVAQLQADVERDHIQRGDIILASLLSMVSGRPAFFYGDPGVDKTGTVKAISRRIHGTSFYEELMSLVPSMARMLVERTTIRQNDRGNGVMDIETVDQIGRAAAAHFVFADELWRAQPDVLNGGLDLSNGDSIRYEGQTHKTLIWAFLAASNSYPESSGDLGAAWSRMTLRIVVNPLNRAGKLALVQSRLNRYRAQALGKERPQQFLTLADGELLRQARPFVDVPLDIQNLVLDILEALLNQTTHDFRWAWNDDRRFGRVFDVLQANALLQGRTTVVPADLWLLEWLFWDTLEQIPVIKAAVEPYSRSALMEAQEEFDVLLAPGDLVDRALKGDRSVIIKAVARCEATMSTLEGLKAKATDQAMAAAVYKIYEQVKEVKNRVIAVLSGTAN